MDPTPEDRAAAVVALRIAAAMALLVEGSELADILVVAAPFDDMDEETQLRTVDLLVGLRHRIPQILLVTRGEVVDLCPEAFDAALELVGEGAGGDGSGAVRTLAAGVGSVRIG
jgi:hypothetical protein